MTEPGTDVSDIEESYQKKRIWQHQFCTGTQKVVLPESNKQAIIEAFGEQGLLNIYPYVQWADQEGLFENYIYIQKDRIDFPHDKTANVVFNEKYSVSQGIILPWEEDNEDDIPYRSLSYINEDENDTHTLYIGMFAHVDLMKDCSYLIGNQVYEEKILKKRYNMSMPITVKSMNCLFWNESAKEWGGEGCLVSKIKLCIILMAL